MLDLSFLLCSSLVERRRLGSGIFGAVRAAGAKLLPCDSQASRNLSRSRRLPPPIPCPRIAPLPPLRLTRRGHALSSGAKPRRGGKRRKLGRARHV